MDKHLYVFYGDALGIGNKDTSRPTTAAGKNVAAIFIEACTESFTTEHGTYHYQPEFREEALAYLASKGVTVPHLS